MIKKNNKIKEIKVNSMKFKGKKVQIAKFKQNLELKKSNKNFII